MLDSEREISHEEGTKAGRRVCKARRPAHRPMVGVARYWPFEVLADLYCSARSRLLVDIGIQAFCFRELGVGFVDFALCA
jgi:hypothetical protein